MKAIVTGVSGNLGFEVAMDLVRRGVQVVPLVRPEKAGTVMNHFDAHTEVISANLLHDDIDFSGQADCIIHCAGIVHFKNAEDKNQEMMRRVLLLAKKINAPVHFISTAFVYRPEGSEPRFNNAYEKDKYASEILLTSSGIPNSIFRPAVLLGNSKTGAIQNFNGFYSIARAFITALSAAEDSGQSIRFPHMGGASNMVPVDQAAKCICDAITESRSGTMFVTNPSPPTSDWVLEETLDFFGLRKDITIVDVPYREFGNLDLTDQESRLYRFSEHFSPYWSLEYDFPPSICDGNLIDHEFMSRALNFFQDTENLHATKDH